MRMVEKSDALYKLTDLACWQQKELSGFVAHDLSALVGKLNRHLIPLAVFEVTVNGQD